MGQGWKMNGMLRGGAWCPAAFLAPKPHENVCWRNFTASEKTMPRAFPGYQDKWPILSTLRVLFCPLTQSHIQPWPELVLHNWSQHTPPPTHLQHCSQEGEKMSVFMPPHMYVHIYTHTYVFTYIDVVSVCVYYMYF